ncbi:MAG: rhodanese-like domain-containing protein [Lewinella sp.]|nr:rhodanese-like domain-containing protein [Lewinella sp.]
MQSADTNSADATTTTYTDLNVEQFAGMMNKKNVVVLDVRTPEETAQGKIDGAMEINVLEDDFADKVQTLDKKKTYLVYCRSGRRSQKAVEIMAGEGFKKLYNLLGGYNAWFAEKN